MSAWAWALVVFQFVILAYFAVLNFLYALFGYLGLRAVIVYARELSSVALRNILERELEMPVSILVPAHNEEAGIVASLHSMLALHYPEFEVVVASDGSIDRTMELLIEHFALVADPRIYRRAITTAHVHRIYRSLRHPNLVAVDKDQGGRADALNAALNMSRHPLVAAIDADSLLDAEAILRASRLFLEDEQVVGVGGTIRPLNGAVMVDGRVTALTGRAGWSALGGLLIISGAFGLFRRDPLVEVGGFSTETVCEDFELTMRLHQRYRRAGKPYKILFSPDPICWTEVPNSMKDLRSQRNRWHRGLWETMWKYRGMTFNPRYGTVGMVALPYFWIFEAIAPVVEALGYIVLPISFLAGVLFWQFALMFVFLAVMLGMLVSQVSVGIETLLLARYPRVRDRVTLFLAGFLEFFGYRQILTVERVLAMLQIRRKRGTWGAMTRTGIPAATPLVTAKR